MANTQKSDYTDILNRDVAVSAKSLSALGYGVSAAELRYDIDKYRKIQTVCAFCGLAFVVLFFGGWGLLGGFIPLISGADSAAEVAAQYSEHVIRHQIGLIIGMTSIAFTIPFFVVISLQMKRTELRTPVLAILQLASGVIVTVVLMIPMLMFVGGTFRPDRSPELTQLVNELSYIMIILPWPPLIGQLVPLIIAIFTDRRTVPVFPRWLGYYNTWVAILLLPASMIIFFKTGPFAWTGLVGFWIPAAVFGSWYLVMTVMVLRAVRQEAEAAHACVPSNNGTPW